MLKINLLPPYIYEKRKIRRTIIAFGVLFVVLIAAMLAWWSALGAKQKELQTQIAQAQILADEVTRLQGQLQTEQGKAPPIESKVKFVDDLMAYNLKTPKLYEELARFTYNRIAYSSVEINSNNQLAIQAHARTVGDCGRYLLNMYRASHIFKSVTINAVPGWPSTGSGSSAAAMPGGMMGGPPGAPPMSGMGYSGPGMPPGSDASAGSAAGFDFTVTCGLVEPIQAPVYGATAPAGGGASAVPGGAPAGGPPGAAPAGGPPAGGPPDSGGGSKEGSSGGLKLHHGGGEE